jgi:hypothetical protein
MQCLADVGSLAGQLHEVMLPLTAEPWVDDPKPNSKPIDSTSESSP